MNILAIETSCDETGMSLLKMRGGLSNPNFEVIENLVASQIKIHAPFGGVVPNLAKREHLKNLPILFNRVMGQGSRAMSRVNLIAVTVGPGLEPALWTGINFAQELGVKYKKPVIGANHLEGHLYSFLLPKKTINKKLKVKSQKLGFPAIALIVSGGHTLLLRMESLARWRKIGETRDDAVGEAFDKVARMLKLPYPGGPEIESLAKLGDPRTIAFPRPMLNQKNFDFSFSGLKTAVLYYLRDHPRANKADVAAAFQDAVLEVLGEKTRRAVEECDARAILLSGGVAANRALRSRLGHMATNLDIPLLAAPLRYNLDNAAMIAAAAYISTFKKRKSYKLAAQGNLTL